MTVNNSANLPHFAYSAQQVKQNEALVAKQQGIEMYSLMHDAATAVFKCIYRHSADVRSVCIVAGGGNNAGDGYLTGKLALLAGLEVSLVAVKPAVNLSGDAALARDEFIAAGGEILDYDEQQMLPQCDVLVDALLGIGFSGALSEQYQKVIEKINLSNAVVYSVDLPSGLNATTGLVSSPTVLADHTVSFIALKQGLLTGNAKQVVGQLDFCGLQLADAFQQAVPSSVSYLPYEILQQSLPKRQTIGYKNSYGHVLIVAGNRGMAGAARLSAEACLRSGAGLVSVLTHSDNVSAVLQGRYELMVHGFTSHEQAQTLLNNVDVVVLGPGLGQDDWAQTLWQLCIKVNKPIVMDADGLNLLAQSKIRINQLVVTPHIGEAARLLGVNKNEIELTRFSTVQTIVSQYNAVCVLKGPGSLVSDVTRTNINRSGCVAMASAGMGDVLSGIIAAFIGQGMALYEATSLAVSLHGYAGECAAEHGARGMLASDLFPYIRKLID